MASEAWQVAESKSDLKTENCLGSDWFLGRKSWQHGVWRLPLAHSAPMVYKWCWLSWQRNPKHDSIKPPWRKSHWLSSGLSLHSQFLALSPSSLYSGEQPSGVTLLLEAYQVSNLCWDKAKPSGWLQAAHRVGLHLLSGSLLSHSAS